MVTIIKPRRRVAETTYSIEWTDETGNDGFVFDCDKDGKLLSDNRWAMRNYTKCLAGDFPDLIYRGIVERNNSWMEPAIARCSCGTEFELTNEYAGARPCPNCKQWYNLYGQELVDPEYWEEDDDE